MRRDAALWFARIGWQVVRMKVQRARDEMEDFVREALDCLYVLVPFLIAVFVSKAEEILDWLWGDE